MGASHVVRKHECLSSIARGHGFSDWRTIWDHPANAELRRRRRNPNVLLPGDEVYVPDPAPKSVACATGATHRFRLRRPTTRLRLALEDVDGHAFAEVAYRLAIDGGEAEEGETDAAGRIDHPVPCDAVRGTLVLWLGAVGDATRSRVVELHLGGLDPSDSVTGAQARLNNLGFRAGREDGVIGPRTRAALGRFQARRGLPVTRKLDDATCAALAEVDDERR